MVASRRTLAGVRIRTSLTATLLVAVVLVLAGTGFVLVQERQLRNAITALTEQHAHDLAIQLDSAGLSRDRLESLVRRDEAIVQIVNPDGSVMAASDSIEESPPVVAVRPAPGSVAVLYVDSLPEEHDDSYVVVARGVATADGDAVIVTAESLATVEQATGVVVRLLAVGLPIVLVLVGLISYWLTGLALAPVRQMRNRVAEITARDRSARVPVSPAGDEITRLAETMNEMLERLEAASARQRRFVADASHELRSPLTAIRTSQEISLAHPENTDWPGTSRDTLAELERLEHLVADLLLLARFDDNDPGQLVVDVDLDDIVETEAARLRRLGSWGVRSVVEPVRLRGDRHQVSRLVRNLVDNATRHTSSTVSLRLRREGAMAVLEIGDDGAGVPPGEEERIFERFVRLDESRERGTGGTGLGLSIAREIARRHGGDVTVVPGNGARPGALFVVHLPTPPPDLDA